MPSLLHCPSRAETVVAAIETVIAEHGAGGLTIRRIAQVSRVSSGSLYHHFEDRGRMLGLAALISGRRRLTEISDRLPSEGLSAFLPRTDDQLVDTRVWLGWSELWRSEPNLEGIICELRGSERHLLADALACQPDSEQAHAAYAFLEGLRIALCAPEDPMPRSAAHQLLAGLRTQPRARHVSP